MTQHEALHEHPAATGAAQTEEWVSTASMWQLMWWRFRQHRLAVVSAALLFGFYTVVLIPDFFAYADPNDSEAFEALIPPQPIHFFDEGQFRPHVFGLTSERDPVTFKRVYVPDPDIKIPVVFFAQGFEYRLLGILPTTLHLVGVAEGYQAGSSVFLFGTDQVGRDLFSRMVYGTQISLSIGLVGVTLSLLIGILLGGISGFYGGTIDLVIQRVIEILRSIPTIPLWLGLAAALPDDLTIIQTYFAITIILSLLGWTELAREIRGRFLVLREEDYTRAAELMGIRQFRIIWRHMVPALTSHIIAVTTLALPSMILSETALSFLGLGMVAPAISWGTLLQDAQNVQAIMVTPWLLLPAIPIVLVILAFNFLGDGLRNAADPYA